MCNSVITIITTICIVTIAVPVHSKHTITKRTKLAELTKTSAHQTAYRQLTSPTERPPVALDKTVAHQWSAGPGLIMHPLNSCTSDLPSADIHKSTTVLECYLEPS